MFPFKRYTLEVAKFSKIEELQKELPKIVQKILGFNPKMIYLNFIKHESTANTIRAWFPQLQEKPVGRSYVYSPTDIIVVATLRQKPADENMVAPDDLEFSVIYVSEWEA